MKFIVYYPKITRKSPITLEVENLYIAEVEANKIDSSGLTN